MQKLLITGGAGFIGSHCIEWFLKQYPNYHIVNLDKLTYAARIDFARQERRNYYFVEGDVADLPLVTALFARFKFDGVIHLAAESHVDRSVVDPLLFIKANVEATGVLLQAAYNHWFEAPHKPRHTNHRFLYASTDEVYGALHDDNQPFVETDLLAPSNPYSATKAAAECLVQGYTHTYGLNTIITRSTNNYGSNQYPEKLIPMIVTKALQKQPIGLHGDGKSIRDWLHVEDHCRAIDCLFHKGKNSEVYNIGANQEKTNLDIAWMIGKILDRLHPTQGQSYTSLIRFTPERIGQDRRYALNWTKIKHSLKWWPSIALDEGIERLVGDYINSLPRPLA